jgi:hypothetical protein
MPNCSTNLRLGKPGWQITIACLLLVSTTVAQNLPKPIRATINFEGFTVGFADTLKAGGKPFWYEASAILYDGRSMLMAHDKPMPNGQSSVGSWPSTNAMFNQQQPDLFPQALFKKGIKYEELAQTPDRKWVFLTTAFDRVKEGSSAWNGYNMLLYWPAGRPDLVQVLGTSPTDSSRTSVALRDRFSSAIALSDLEYYGVVRYFKIEGLTVTADRLIFGVREEGNSFQDFKHVVRVLAVPYQVVGATDERRIELTGPFTLLGSVDIKGQVLDKLPDGLALSSIEYDPARKNFWVLTSFEGGDTVGAYLWYATEAELVAGQMNLVRTTSGEPLRLGHKAEDMTFLTPNTLLLIHDDDRLPTKVGSTIRQPNQSAYTVLDLK